MSLPEDDEKKKLYEFDNSYLDDLNQIRQQFNLVEIVNEEHVEKAAPQIPPSPPFTFNEEELYECNTDYMTNLNDIRKQLNLKEIIDNTTKELESREIEMNTILLDNNTTGQSKKQSNSEMDDHYTPPRKKKCIKESTTEDSVKHVKFHPRSSKQPSAKTTDIDKSFSYKAYPLVKSPEVEKSNMKISVDQTFCSLNMPTSSSPKQKELPSKVTILVDEESLEIKDKPQNDVNVNWLTSSLDIPKILREKFNFPSIVYIDKWAKLSQEFKFGEIFSHKSEKKIVQKNVNFSDFIAVSQKDPSPENDLFEVRTISSLNNMYRLRTETNDVKTTDSTLSDTKSESDDEDKTKCRCFSICFNNRLKNFFS